MSRNSLRDSGKRFRNTKTRYLEYAKVKTQSEESVARRRNKCITSSGFLPLYHYGR